MSVRTLIARHRELVMHDETLFNDDGDMIVDVTEAEASEQTVLAAFNDMVAAPCLSLADVQAKVSYLLNGTVGERTPIVEDLTGPDGSETFAEEGPLMSFLRSLVAPPSHSSGEDRMLDLATGYIEANTRLNASGIEDDDAVDAYCVEHIDPLRDEIAERTPTATTLAGALAALRLIERCVGQADVELARPLMSSMIGYLEGAPANDPCAAFFAELDEIDQQMERVTLEEEAVILPRVNEMNSTIHRGEIPPASTARGAAAALRYAIQCEHLEQAELNLVRTALAFLEGGHHAA